MWYSFGNNSNTCQNMSVVAWFILLRCKNTKSRKYFQLHILSVSFFSLDIKSETYIKSHSYKLNVHPFKYPDGNPSIKFDKPPILIFLNIKWTKKYWIFWRFFIPKNKCQEYLDKERYVNIHCQFFHDMYFFTIINNLKGLLLLCLN